MTEENLAPFEMDCDAPSYSIVKACQRLGIKSPEDVRWCRLSRLSDRGSDWGQALLHPWKFFANLSEPGFRACLCGYPFPFLERCTFTLLSGREESYLMGQCKNCRTIFWDEIQVTRPAASG
jgi:hypothetical protein